MSLAVRLFLWYYWQMQWDYTKTEYDKQKAADPIWHLERLINFGLGNEKLEKKLLEKYLDRLHIPKDRKNLLELLVWNKQF